ncbi:MAG TPA: HipA family kinase [Oculatellaceae cyanobacterium]
MLQAIRLLQTIDADSKPILVRASDGKAYVTKWVFRGRENRRLINELLAAAVLEHMAVLSPKVDVVLVTDEFIRKNRAQLQRFFGKYFCNLKPGLVFASQVDEELERTSNTPPLERIVNLSDFHTALVTDVFLCQGDKRQAIFERISKRQYRAKFIDNANALESTWWQFKTAPNAVYYDKSVYSELTVQQIETAIVKLSKMPRTVIENAIAQIPKEWIEGDRGQLEHVAKVLRQRQRNLRFLMHRFLHGDNAAFFPETLLREIASRFELVAQGWVWSRPQQPKRG